MPDDAGTSQRHFRDVTEQFGLSDVVSDRVFLGAAFGDYDRDGWADLFLSSYFGGRSVLLKNTGGKRFEPTELMRTTRSGFTAAFLDVNHDGQLDLFHAGHGSARSVTESAVFSNGSVRSASAIFVQQDGAFEERIDVFRDGMPIGTMGTSFGDINNDGALDFYLGTGSPEGSFILPNLFYVGETVDGHCTGFARNASVLHSLGTVQKGHGIVFFDFENDGDQDIYSSLGGMWPGDAWPNQFFVNNSRLEHHWVKVRLRGRQTNYYGVGAMIRVAAKRPNGESIDRYYPMNNKTGFGSTPYVAHIGLMDAANIQHIEVFWPVSKKTKFYTAQPDRMYELDENGTALERVLTAAPEASTNAAAAAIGTAPRGATLRHRSR